MNFCDELGDHCANILELVPIDSGYYELTKVDSGVEKSDIELMLPMLFGSKSRSLKIWGEKRKAAARSGAET